MSDHLTPIQVCERMIGPPPVLAEINSYDRTAAYGWRQAAKNRDAGDLPSTRVMRALLAYASARNIPLTADHLIWGAPASEIEALLAAAPAQSVAAE